MSKHYIQKSLGLITSVLCGYHFDTCWGPFVSVCIWFQGFLMLSDLSVILANRNTSEDTSPRKGDYKERVDFLTVYSIFLHPFPNRQKTQTEMYELMAPTALHDSEKIRC